MPACLCACVRVCLRMCVRACMCACVRACVRACERACACVRACVHACERTCARSSLHGCSASCGGAPCVSHLFAVSCSFWSCNLSVLPRRLQADMRVHGVESISSCFCCIPRVGCRWSRQGFFDSTVVSLCAGWGVILLANPPVTALVSRGLKQIPFSGPHSGYENVSPNSWVTFC